MKIKYTIILDNHNALVEINYVLLDRLYQLLILDYTNY